MASYPPPIEIVPIFNSADFVNTTQNLNQDATDLLYVHFPVAQGANTLVQTLIEQQLTVNGTSNLHNVVLAPSTSSSITFSDGTIQSSAGITIPIIEAHANVFSALNTFNAGITGTTSTFTSSNAGTMTVTGGFQGTTGSFSTSLTSPSISATTFTGALTGNATTATTATTASNINLTSDNSTGIYYIPFSKTITTSNALYIDNVTGPLTYNPSAGNLTAPTFTGALSGTATNASNVLTTTSNTTVINLVGGVTNTLTYQLLYMALALPLTYNTSNGTLSCPVINSTTSITSPLITSALFSGIGGSTQSNIFVGVSGTRAGNGTLTTGANSVAIGAGAGFSMTTSAQNVLIGTNAGRSMTTAGSNVAIGSSALFANNNTVAGNSSNVAVGASAGVSNLTSFQCTYVGGNAGTSHTAGDLNTFLGYGTSTSVGTVNNSTALGYNARVTGNNQIMIGTSAETTYIPGAFQNTSSTTKALFSADVSANGVIVGRGGGNLVTNTIVGQSALPVNVNGTDNTAIGYQALNVVTGSLGQILSVTVTYGGSYTAGILTVGTSTLVVTGGGGAGAVITCQYAINTTPGQGYLPSTVQIISGGQGYTFSPTISFPTPSGCTLVASPTSTNTFSVNTGIANTSVGSGSLISQTGGNSNTALGYQAGSNLTSGSYNTCIGYGSQVPNATYNNQLVLGTAAETTYIPGNMTVTGTSNINGTTNFAQLPLCSQVPTLPNQLVTKSYVDGNTISDKIYIFGNALPASTPYVLLNNTITISGLSSSNYFQVGQYFPNFQVRYTYQTWNSTTPTNFYSSTGTLMYFPADISGNVNNANSFGRFSLQTSNINNNIGGSTSFIVPQPNTSAPFGRQYFNTCPNGGNSTGYATTPDTLYVNGVYQPTGVATFGFNIFQPSTGTTSTWCYTLFLELLSNQFEDTTTITFSAL